MKNSYSRFNTSVHNASIETSFDRRSTFYTSIHNILSSKHIQEENKENLGPGLSNQSKMAYAKTNTHLSLRESISQSFAHHGSLTSHSNLPPTSVRFSLFSKLSSLTQPPDPRLPNSSSFLNNSLPIKLADKTKTDKNQLITRLPLSGSQCDFKNRISLKCSSGTPIDPATERKSRGAAKVILCSDPLQHYYAPIINHLYRTQPLNRSFVNPLRRQTEINKRMRSVLFNWLLQVHRKFGLKPRTFFLISNIFDRYLIAKRIKRNELQLVGISCLLIASKYEDIYPPEVQELCALTDNTYNRVRILEAESDILVEMGFDLVFVAAIDVMEVLAKEWKIETPEVIEFGTMVLFIFAFYHFSDKFGAFKLGTFALANAAKVILGKTLAEASKYLSEEESGLFESKLQRILLRLKYDNLTVLNEKFASCLARIS